MEKEIIIDIAEKIFINKGYDDTSMDDIAIVAKISKEKIQECFKNKKYLYMEVIKRIFDRLGKLLESIQSSETRAQSKVMKLLSKVYLEFITRHTDLMKLNNNEIFMDRELQVEVNNYQKVAGIIQKLTPREIQVVDHLIQGKTNKEISNELVISLKTIKNHINHIYKKLGLKGRKDIINIL